MGTQSLDHCGAVFQLDGGTIEVDTRSNAETVGARNEAEQIYTSSDSVVIAHQSRTAWISYDQPNATEEGVSDFFFCWIIRSLFEDLCPFYSRDN